MTRLMTNELIIDLIRVLDHIRRNGGFIKTTDASMEYANSFPADLENIQSEDIPIVIGKSFDLIKDLESRIEKASDSAENAKSNAQSAYNKGVKLLERKSAIEALQSSGRDIAAALVDGIDAQKLSFELHGQLAEVTKYLFALGVGSVALNRSVVRELEAKLSGASKEELSELARLEVIGVIRQLKAQEDMMSKQEKMNGILKEHDDEIVALFKSNEQLDELIKIQVEAIAHINAKLEEQHKTIEQFKEESKTHSDTHNLHSQKLDELLIQLEKQKQSSSALERGFFRKVIIAYILGGIGVLVGIAGVLLFLFT